MVRPGAANRNPWRADVLGPPQTADSVRPVEGRAVGPPGSSEAPHIGWGVPDAAVAFLLSLLAASIAETPFLTHGKLPQSSQVPASLAALAVQTTTAVVYLSFAARRGVGSLRADFGLRLSPKDSGWFLVGLGLAFMAGIGLTPIVDAGNLDRSGQSSQSVVRVFQSAHGSQAALFIVAVLVVAPLGEELLFRGALLRALMRRTNPTAAVAISALVFALVHVALDPGAGFAVPALFLLGLVSGDRALKTGDLSESFLLHAGFNLLAVLQILL
jgi:membrane protease YdiL (CAAX protease family)